MITLEAGQTLQGVAGTATAVTYTVDGDELTIATGADVFKVLAQGQLAAATGVLGAAVGAGKAWLIKSIHLANTTASNVTGVKLFIGGTAAANQITGTMTIPANGTAVYAADGWSVYDSSGVKQFVGSTGPSGTVAVGSVTNIGTAGPPTVTNVGTPQAAVLNFGLQQGATGSTGPPGVVQTVTAGDSSITAAGTAANPTVAVSTAFANSKFNVQNGVLTGVSGATHAAGKLVYDTDNESLTFFNNDPNVALQIGQEQWIRVRNVTGSTIANGQAVYINGANSGLPTIALAQANAAGTFLVAGLTTESIANNATGFITSAGMVRGIDTSAFATGAPLYLSATTPGALTATLPTGSNYRFRVGSVAVSNASTGTIQVQLGSGVTDATTTTSGQMSAADKLKEDNIHYDIVADGGADRTGVVDATTIIQNAINTVAAAGGGIVYIPRGTFKVSSTITITGNFVTVRGASRVASKIVPTAAHATGNIFTISGIFNRFEYIRIEPASFTTRTAGYAFEFTSTASNCGCQWVDILGMWSGVRATGQLCRLEDMNIRECGYGAVNGCIILIDSFTDQYISKIVCDNGTVGPNAPQSGFSGIRITNLSSLLMSDCQIIHCGTGLDLSPAGTNTIPSIYCMNTFFDQGTYGARFTPGTGNIFRCRFMGVWFSGNSVAGVQLNGTSINGVDFIGCEFYGAPSQPIGIDAVAATEWSVRASRFAGNSTNAIRTTAGAAHSFSITDCIIGAVSGVTANAQGINIQAGTYARYQVLDNRGLESNTTPGIIDLGTVAATGQKNVGNNMGALVSGSFPALTSGGAALHANDGRGAVTTGTGETFIATYRVPANSVTPGQMFQLTALVQISTTGTLAARIRCGATGAIATDTAVNIAATSPASTTTNQWHTINAYVYVTALGATGTVYAVPTGQTAAVSYNPPNAVAEAPGNVNTTAPWFITFSLTASAGVATVRQVKLRAI